MAVEQFQMTMGTLRAKRVKDNDFVKYLKRLGAATNTQCQAMEEQEFQHHLYKVFKDTFCDHHNLGIWIFGMRAVAINFQFHRIVRSDDNAQIIYGPHPSSQPFYPLLSTTSLLELKQ